jgi:hypothetical protein
MSEISHHGGSVENKQQRKITANAVHTVQCTLVLLLPEAGILMYLVYEPVIKIDPYQRKESISARKN